MAARSKARKRALDILFAADARGVSPLETLEARIADTEATPLGDYAESVVRGVEAHLAHIDDVIATHAIGWSLERMPAVDRAILRIASYEIIYDATLDTAVSLNEAVELAKSLSTDDSPRFVNGVLAQIAATVRGDARRGTPDR